MEFLGWCIGLSLVLWVIYFFVASACNTVNSCVQIKKDIDKIKENKKK